MGQAPDGQPCHHPALAGSRGTCASARDTDATSDALHALAVLHFLFSSLSFPGKLVCCVFSVVQWDSWENISVHVHLIKFGVEHLNRFPDASVTNPAYETMFCGESFEKKFKLVLVEY